MQELPTDFLKLSLLLPLRLLKHMSRRHAVSDLLLGAFSFPSVQYLALHFFLISGLSQYEKCLYHGDQ